MSNKIIDIVKDLWFYIYLFGVIIPYKPEGAIFLGKIQNLLLR